LFAVSLLALTWFVMTAVHELGHVGGDLATGGSIERVILSPLTISRTDFSLLHLWHGLGSLQQSFVDPSLVTPRMAYLVSCAFPHRVQQTTDKAHSASSSRSETVQPHPLFQPSAISAFAALWIT
jgi:hypothetical protein